jgi:hypothetical protein
VTQRARSAQPLGTRALNRAVLARQLLLERSDLDLVAVVERMGGIQAQYAPAAYIGLWSRLRGFERHALTRALEDRSLVQGTLMRSTIHIVSAADYWPMATGVGAARREWWLRAAGPVDEATMERAADLVRGHLSTGPKRKVELLRAVEDAGLPRAAWTGVGMWVDMVRVPPSGTWERRRADLYGLAEDWVPRRDVDPQEAADLLVRRYLGGFGPAAAADIAGWAGIPLRALAPALDRLDLRRFSDDGGRELLDLPDAPLTDAETPVPVRFIATWDAMLLVHARRTQVLPEAYRPRIFNTKTPHSFPTFLIDGQVAGTWRHEGGAIKLEPYRPLSARERRELGQEAGRLAAFMS